MTLQRFIPPIAARVKDPDIERVLRNHDDRIRELVRRFEQVASNVIPRTEQPSQPEGGLIPFSALTITTGTARRWCTRLSGNTLNVLGPSWCIPPGYTKLTALSLSAFGPAGAPSTTTQTFVITLGDATTEADTALSLTVPVTSVGTYYTTNSVPCSAGQAMRCALIRSAGGGTQMSDSALLVTLER